MSLDAPRLRPERLIAAGRVVLAVFSLFAVWLDPTEPAYYAQVAYGLLAAYVAYAVLIASLLWRAEAVSPAWPVVTHVADLTFFSLFIFFTAGPASPFTVYFVFALTCATLRWQVRGTLWTALVTLTAFGSFGVYFGVIQRNPDFDLTAFIIRGVYMFVLAVLLGYVGFHDQRLLRELRILASWPQAVAHDVESLARELLAYAGPLLEAPRVILAWTEQDAPWRRVATWERASWEHERHSAAEPLVASSVRGRSFIRSARQPARTMAREPGLPHLVACPGESLDAEFAARFSIRGALSVPITGGSFEGRLFFLDQEDATLDDLVLAEIVAGMVAARFDAFYLTEQLRHAAATEERIRLARDLHDGVLQSFTGVALRLAAVRRVLRRDPEAAAEALQSAQDVLASEQRDLRFFIQELRPTLFALEDERELDARLRDLAQQMEREWDLRVALEVRLADGLSPALCRDLYHLVREALVNAARHGAASAAQVRLDAETPEGIVVTIADNGRGFPFTGEYSGSELAERDLGPKTLRERVQAMQGTLTLQSSDAGAELYIVLPGAA